MHTHAETNQPARKYHYLKSERLEARVSREQKHLFQQAADLLGRNLTDFVIASLQEAAARVIHEHEILRLSHKDSQFFVKLLLNPPEPNHALLTAVKRYKKEVKSEE